MTQRYWDGGTWVYHADITNDGSNSGAHVYTLVPGEGSDLEILYGTVLNGDAAARTVTIEVTDGTNRILRMAAFSLGATTNMPLPFVATTQGDESGWPSRFILSGTMQLEVTVAAVAVSKDTALGIACRIRSSPPTVILASPTDAVEVVNTDKVF